MGPSCLIGPVIIFSEKIFIKGPPIINTIISDVITDNPVRNVKYLKTFKKEYGSIREVNKLNNIQTFYHFFTQNIQPCCIGAFYHKIIIVVYYIAQY